MEKQEYLRYKSKLIEIYNKWVKDIERTEQDFKEFFASRQQVFYYEGCRKLKQQKSTRKLLELLAKTSN